MLKIIYQFIMNQLVLFQSPLHNAAAMIIIASISFKIAWKVSPGGQFGSIIHWTVRIFVVLTFVFMVSGIIWIIKFITKIPIWIWILLICASIALYLYYKTGAKINKTN